MSVKNSQFLYTKTTSTITPAWYICIWDWEVSYSKKLETFFFYCCSRRPSRMWLFLNRKIFGGSLISGEISPVPGKYFQWFLCVFNKWPVIFFFFEIKNFSRQPFDNWGHLSQENFPKWRFAQKQMKSGLRKNGRGGETGVSSPQRPLFLCSILIPHCQKMFLKKLECICRSHKKYFWPNCLPAKYTSACKKMLPKWQFSFYPFCYGRKWPKCFKKILGNVSTLYSSNQGFVRIKKLKTT